LVVANNGFVGIGTVNPYSALHVYGSSTGKIIGLISNANTALGSSACLQYGLWPLSGSSQTGTNSPSAEISAIVLNAANGNTDLAFSVYTGSSIAPNYTLVERMRITAAGNVGIGGTNPMYKTQIVLASNSDPGNSNVFGLTTADSSAQSQRLYMGLVDNGGTGTNSYSWISASRFGNSYNTLAFQPVGGNVGIGTTNPVGALSVLLDGLGDAGGGGAWNSSYALFGPGANNGNGSCVGITYNTATNEGGLICITPNVLWRNMKYSARQHLFYANGNATPGFTIDLARTIYFGAYTANGTLSIVNATSGQVGTTSDRRIKENITYQSDTQQGLASVLNLKPATFNFIGSSDSHLGFIAQDLEQEIPMAVDGKKYEWQWEIEDGKPKFDANGNIVYKLDADGNKIIRPRGLSDRAIIATQTLAIQELAKQATSQATLVQELEKKATSHSEIVQELVKKLTTAEQQLAAKSTALDALIAWAQTQGYSVTA
jgi:hypothetical protein